ncbi:hypothetical protein RHGRI_026254 [Rhododendron griersonianum]|nr:hypothetical protein RHGRI_026254 [Rhododendron griersonianum]
MRADVVPQLPPSHLFESSTPKTLPSIVQASNIAIPSSSASGFLFMFVAALCSCLGPMLHWCCSEDDFTRTGYGVVDAIYFAMKGC